MPSINRARTAKTPAFAPRDWKRGLYYYHSRIFTQFAAQIGEHTHTDTRKHGKTREATPGRSLQTEEKRRCKRTRVRKTAAASRTVHYFFKCARDVFRSPHRASRALIAFGFVGFVVLNSCIYCVFFSCFDVDLYLGAERASSRDPCL